ncbi:MAG: hypothetical protein IMW94_01940 [Thermoanaerobacter sp.]|nr:hypothetical protein [Thermoanaerobacter sp.]
MLKSAQRELEATVNRLEAELREERQKEKELVALREFVFSLDQEPVQEREELPDLNRFAGAIVGGHPRWQDRMRQLLPEWVFISSENFDVKVLDRVEVIVLFPAYMSHSHSPPT